MSTDCGNDRVITEYKTETCSLSKVHWHVCIRCNSGKRGRETIMAKVWITILQTKWVNLGCVRCMWPYSYLTSLLMPKCVHNDSKKEINLKNEPSFLCSQEKGKGQPGAGRFFPFRRNAPAVLMNGFSLEAGLLLNALFATLFRNLQRVGACACHSIISLVHLKAFRSFDDVEHNTDLFCFTGFLHSLSNLTSLIYETFL